MNNQFVSKVIKNSRKSQTYGHTESIVHPIYIQSKTLNPKLVKQGIILESKTHNHRIPITPKQGPRQSKSSNASQIQRAPPNWTHQTPHSI